MLSSLDLRPEYHKDTDDIAQDFYLPCVREAVRYERITGYFSSAVYVLAWPELRGFVKRGGRIRVLCSPVLSRQDIDGLTEGHSGRRDALLGARLRQSLAEMLADERLGRPARALACLVTAGVVDLKVAVVGDHASTDVKRMFHDKVGVFIDEDGDAVGFRGSMNETYLGLAADGNLESIDVFPSWEDGRDASRVKTALRRFDKLWNGEVAGVLVQDFPSAAGELLREAAADVDWELLVDELCAELAAAAAGEDGADYRAEEHRQLLEHQAAFLDNWTAAGMRGIAEHATGSGKTFTALTAIRRALVDGYAPVVVVPRDLLLRQWAEELKDAGIEVLECGGGASAWRSEGLLGAWLRRSTAQRPKAAVAVVKSAATQAFIAQMPHDRQLLLVADECHWLGSPRFRDVLQIEAAARLGLSATPRRAGDPEGTAVLFEYFGGVVKPVYTLADAISDDVLTPYQYHPQRVELTDDEQADWQEQTVEIKRRVARLGGTAEGEIPPDERLKLLLIQRARIVKKAAAKVQAAVDIVRGSFQSGQKWLVYCEDVDQLGQVRAALRTAGIDTLEYHSAMAGDREQTLLEFEINGGVLVSIRCLDEGVNIPATTHAVILASSKNPREFIQRRGRVLRKHPGKSVAHVYDVLVTPRTVTVEDGTDKLVFGELARALKFSEWAENPTSGVDIRRICVELGLDIDAVADLGVEDDDSDA